MRSPVGVRDQMPYDWRDPGIAPHNGAQGKRQASLSDKYDRKKLRSQRENGNLVRDQADEIATCYWRQKRKR